ncbi:glycyl-radical enzyme activating family protein, partial [Vibrio harveyi]
KVFCAF